LRLPEGLSATLAVRLWQQNDSLPARRVKDVRTALAYLAARDDVAANRMALWGEGFSEPNGVMGRKRLFEETGFRQCSPTPKRLAEPAGACTALLAALRPVKGKGRTVRVRAVLMRGGLYAFESVLAGRYHYIPVDAAIPGLLRVADVVDLVRALQKEKIAVLAEDLRDGCNGVVNRRQLGEAWGDAAPPAYEAHPTDAAIEGLVNRLVR
jgi:hypothetical protein